MKLVKFQITRDYLNRIGLKSLFENIERLEILTAYHYDRESFFSLQQITFDSGIIENLPRAELESLITKKFFASFLKIHEIKANTVVCTMHQRIPFGFWNIPEDIPWAMQFPVVVGHKYLLLTSIVADEYLDRLKAEFEKFFTAEDPSEFRVLAQSSIFKKGDFGHTSANYPPFTAAQQKIASYAASQGYYESPKKVSAKAIAEKFRITESAVNSHLRNAGNLAMRFFFGSD